MQVTCYVPGCTGIHPHLTTKKRKVRNYETGFRDGVKVAAAIQVIVFSAVGIGYAVAVALGLC